MGQTLSLAALEAAGIIERLRDAGIDETDPDFHQLLDAEVEGPERARRMLWVALEAEDQAAAVERRVQLLQARKSRLEDRAKRLRDTVLWMMGEMGMAKLPAPEFTATVSTPKVGPFIVTVDVNELPARFVRVKKEVDKRKVNEADRAGEDLTAIGVRGNPKPSLTIKQS